MQNYDEETAERITPHAMTGEDREDYLDKLWAAFTEVATAGVIVLQAAHNIVEDLSIDGEERYLETHVPKEKWQQLSFDDLVKYLDDMSRAASAEYQDAAEATREMKFNQQSEGAETEDESKLMFRIKRKLHQIGEIVAAPKVMLIASTNALMIVVCAALIIGLAVSWNKGSESWFQEHVSIIQTLSQSAIEGMVADMEREQTESLEDVSRLMSIWLSMRLQLSQTYTHKAGVAQRLRRLSTTAAEVHRIANAKSFETGYLTALQDIRRRIDSSITNETLISNLTSTIVSPRFSSRTNYRAALCTSTAVATARRSNTSISFVPFTNNSVCLILINSTTLHVRATTAIQSINSKMPDAYGYMTVFDRNGTTGPLALSATTTPPLGCLDENMVQYCSATAAAIRVNASQQVMESTRFLFNDTYYLSIMNIIPNQTFVGLALSTKVMQTQMQDDILSYANSVNDASSDIATKLGWKLDVALRNISTGAIIPRASASSTSDCVIDCDLPDLTKNEILRSFENGTAKSDDTVTLPGANYVPVTLSHAFSKGSTGIEFVAYISSPRANEKVMMFDRLISSLNSFNKAAIGTIETVVAGLAGMPPQQTFYAYDPCPEGVHCIVDPLGPTNANGSLGTVYRYDCRSCQRMTVKEEELGQAVMLTDPWRIGRSYADEGCDSRSCMREMPHLRNEVLHHASSTGTLTDYSGEEILYSNSYLTPFSVLLESKVDKKHLKRPVQQLLGIATGISVLVLVLGITSLWFFADRNFGVIEKDWAHFKKQIQREKDRFANLVKGFIPPHVVDRMVGGHRVLVDQTQGSAFAFIDLCAFSTESRTWQPKQISRYLAYCFFVMEEVCTTYNVMKLRTVGDLFCSVASRLERVKDTKEDPSQHPVRRAMDMAATLMLLFSPSYEHYPQNCKNFRDIFKERHQDGRPTSMPVLRIGMHIGPAVGGAFSVGSTSHFDFFGAGPALANRMQLTALPGRIHVTSVIREALKARDPEHCYTFDGARKTIVRGQGTIASYFVKSVLIHAPTSLTEPMGIRPATKRVDFTVQKRKNTDSSVSEHSE